jgi:hypothetical protein
VDDDIKGFGLHGVSWGWCGKNRCAVRVPAQPALWGKDATGDVAGAAWITRFDRPIPGRAGGPLAGLRFAVKDTMDVAGW